MHDETDPTFPPKLADAIGQTYTHRVAIPASLDASILGTARQKFNARRRLRLMVRWGTGLAAGLAAVLVLIVYLSHPVPAKSIAKGDVNTDGQLNIIDALALANHLAAKDKLDSTWDINHDGIVDQKDVDAIATAAVSLKQGTLARGSLPKLIDVLSITPSPGIPGEGRGEGLRHLAARTPLDPVTVAKLISKNSSEEARP